jgi:hypothetical protein
VKNGFPVFSTVLEANAVGKAEDEYAAFKLTDEDKQDIHRLARDPRIGACQSISEKSLLPHHDVCDSHRFPAYGLGVDVACLVSSFVEAFLTAVSGVSL